MRSYSLATIILNWNDAESTIRCGESVLRAYQSCNAHISDARLVIVDNGSVPGQVSMLAKWCKSIVSYDTQLICSSSNVGFAAGMNLGIERALQSTPDFCWLLNNDIEVDYCSINSLLELSNSHPGAAIIGATMVDSSSGLVHTAGGYIYYKSVGFNRPLLGGLELESIKGAKYVKPGYVDGAAMWLRADFLNRIGGIPEYHFLYFEELELMQRLMPCETIEWCPDAIVYHKGGGSSPTPELRARGTYHAALSAFRYTWTYHPIWLPSVIVARIIGITMRAIRLREPGLLTAVLKAIVDFGFSRTTTPDV